MTPQENIRRINAIEHLISREYLHGHMRTPIHLCVGQEHVCVAVCESLTKHDLLFSYYRSHGWYLAKGGDLTRMIAELYGRSTGCSGGHGGSMHLIDESVGFMGTTAIVGAQLPHAVGAALALEMQNNTNDIVVCVFGDGASEEGLFMESLMYASLRRLRVLFVCMNDSLATNVPFYERQPRLSGPAIRAQSFGVESLIVDANKNDYPSLTRQLERMVDNVRDRRRPYLLEVLVSRQCDHVGPHIYSLPIGIDIDVQTEMTSAMTFAKESQCQS